MSSNNSLGISTQIWNRLSRDEKSLLVRYSRRNPTQDLSNLSLNSLKILAASQENYEQSNPGGNQLTAAQQQLQQEAEAVRTQLQNLTGQTVQQLQNTVQSAISIQNRIEQQTAAIQEQLDLTEEIEAAQAEIIRRLQQPSRPTPQPTPQPEPQPPSQEPGLEPGIQPSPDQEEEEEESPEPLGPTDIFSSLDIVPVPDITPPLDSTLALREYLQLRDSNNIRYTIPYVINDVLNEYRLTEFLDQPLPRFYNTVNTYIDNYINANLQPGDTSELNANELSIVNANNIRIANVNAIIDRLPQKGDYIVVSPESYSNIFDVPGVPYPQISAFTQASQLLRQQGINVALGTTTVVNQRLNPQTRRYIYQQVYTAHISRYVEWVNLSLQTLVNQNNELIGLPISGRH